jgi:hypothetical protein
MSFYLTLLNAEWLFLEFDLPLHLDDQAGELEQHS